MEAVPALPKDFGFKAGASGAHASRTIMLEELSVLMAATPPTATKDDYLRLVVNENILGKSTTSNRRLTARHLADLYAMDSSVTVFRLLRHFWDLDPAARPVLSLTSACARDPLLRATVGLVTHTAIGEKLTRDAFIKIFQELAIGRFSPATQLSLAQNTAASWMHAGYLQGRMKKMRKRPVITPTNAAYALALGYLCGLRGQFLLQGFWASLLDSSTDQLLSLVKEASKRGLLDYRGIGSIIDITFPNLLNSQEIQVVHGAH